MNFTIIGTGNMAHFLAKELSAAGHSFQGIWGRNNSAAILLAKQYNTVAHNELQDIKDEDGHFCFLAIRDTAIASIADQFQFQHSTLIHTAGASSLQLLGEHSKYKAVFWPIYSIVADNTKSLNQIPIAVEGNKPETEKAILSIAESISQKAFIASENQRLHLHLAAVFTNNFCNHLMSIAQEICTHQHISFDYLQPIIAQTFERLKTESANEVQTGPAIRDDKMTMQKHLEMLKGSPEWALLYQSLSASIRKMYKGNEE